METRIVVIDNDDSMRDLFTLWFNREGRQVFSYPYAQIDLTTIEQLHPDLIILDFNMPEGGIGWQFLQLLKMADTTAKIPILIITAAFQLSAEVRGYLSSRYISVVHKPFELAMFLKLVQNIITMASHAGEIFSSDRLLPILMVDDNEDLVDTVTTILMLEGYQAVSVHNGRDALDRVSRVDHCLILLNIEMPFMNGFEFLIAYDRQLRPHTPVIIVSGEPDIHQHILPSFVVKVVSKPFDMRKLLIEIEKYAHLIDAAPTS